MFVNTTGYYIPNKRIYGDYFIDINGLTEDWIFSRTGIRTRSRATEKETIDYMCIKAVEQALPGLPYDAGEIDLIVFASYTPSDTIATTGHIIQRTFKMEKAKVFYISSACCSAINGIEVIQSFFLTGKSSKALLVCGERNSSYSDDSDKSSGHLWGDGAVAYFFSNETTTGKEPKVLDVISQGLGHVGLGPQAITLDLERAKLEMPHGKDVFIHACNFMAKNAKEILKKNGSDISDLSYFIGHQANMRILRHVASELNISPEKTLCNIENLGNTGSASTLLVFAQNREKFRNGDLVCISVFGGGYSAGACLIKIYQ